MNHHQDKVFRLITIVLVSAVLMSFAVIAWAKKPINANWPGVLN